MESGAIRRNSPANLARHGGSAATEDGDDKDPLSKVSPEEPYEIEKIDFFVGITIVLALAFEGSQQAKLEHKSLSIAWVTCAVLECLLVFGYFAFATLMGGPKKTYKYAFLVMHLPVILFILVLLVWNIARETQ
jgi:hypothetical protein